MKGDQMYREDKATFNIAWLKIGGEKFEVAIHPDAAVEYREGKRKDLKEALVSDHIFADAHKGLAASEHTMKAVFKTDSKDEILKTILMKGEIQLTSEYREKQREQKLKSLINIIHRNAIDPRTNMPHPPQRIENAMTEAKVHLDDHKKVEDQLQDVLKKIRTVLPLKFETRELSVRIPAQFAAKSFHILKGFGSILGEAWQNDGSLMAQLEMPAGMQQDFMDQLNKLTHGDCEIKIVRTR